MQIHCEKISMADLVRFFPSSVLIVEQNGTILADTLKASEMFGLSNANGLKGMKIWDLIAPVDREAAHIHFHEFLLGKNGQMNFYHHLKANNTIFSAVWKMSVVRSEAGEVKAVIIEMHDEAFDAEGRDGLTEKIVQTIAYVAEMRDKYTARHQRRVAHLAHAIAQEMGLPPSEVVRIHMIANIHDIGKICVPAEFLSKPDRLTKEEFDVIKSHVRAGLNILQNLGCPSDIFTGVYQHHERLNGKGYPEGISEANICIPAKVLAVCDVVEAMASHRPYRPALGVDAALEEITDRRGEAYDSDVSDVCVNLFTRQNFSFGD